MRKRLVLVIVLLAATLAPSLARAEAGLFTLPADLKVVGVESFYGDKALRTVKVPYGVTGIERRAFASSMVSTAYLPETLTRIADDAFDDTPLSTVHAQEGTFAWEWAQSKGYAVVDDSNPASDFTYKPYTSTGCEITGYVGQSVTVRIPRFIEGRSVLRISDEAFQNNAVIERVEIPGSVAYVGNYAFAGCTALKSAQMPDSLTQIGQMVFRNCTSLKSVRLPGNLTQLPAFTFCDCTSLETVDLPDSIVEIYDYAFNGCTALTSISLPQSLTAIRSSAFAECTALASIELPASLTSIDGSAFYDCKSLTSVALPKALTTLGDAAFYGCASLRTVSFAPGCALTEIGSFCFYTTGLTGITLPASVTSLGDCVFSTCPALEFVELNGDFDSIGNHVFFKCKVLKRVTMPDSVKRIGMSAFYGCTSLETVRFSRALTYIGDSAFYNCNAMTSLDLPASLTELDEHAFEQCSGLTRVRFPSNSKMKTLGKNAFAYCTALESVELPCALEAIGASSFYYCTGLLGIDIPATVTSIGEKAFGDMRGQVTFLGDAPDFSDDAFTGGAILAVYPHARSSWASAIQGEYGAQWVLWRPDDVRDPVDSPLDASEPLTVGRTDNWRRVNWARWAEPVNSYLVNEADGGFTRVEYWNEATQSVGSGGAVYVERYDSNENLIWKKTLAAELPIWGGFFSGAKYNFLVFGQNNEAKDNSVEVMRVVRYTKNWHRVDAAGAFGEATCQPFYGGKVSMSESGEVLYIHTCHLMYNGHQASMNFRLYVPAMKFAGDINEMNFVSHSFNQWVVVDGNDVIMVDHGDASPRSIQLMRFKDSAGKLRCNPSDTVTVLPIGGDSGDNWTGAFLGGLEISNSAYLMAGRSIDQSRFGSTSRFNIFVATVDKDNVTDSGVTFRWITNYAESDTRILSAPQLVKISDSRFLIMWTECDEYQREYSMYHAFLNGKGERTSEIYVSDGNLSDCEPVVSGNKVTWYVTTQSEPVFYSIDLNHPGTVLKN